MKERGNLGQNETLYFLSPIPRPKNTLVPLTVPIADATLYTFLFHLLFLCPSAGYPSYATAGCERKDKKFYVIKSCPPPPNFFDSFTPLPGEFDACLIPLRKR